MNEKQTKKLRKLLREQLKNGLDTETKDATLLYCYDLEKKLVEKQKEIDALCEVIKSMQEQMNTEAKQEYEEMPEVLK